MRVEELRIGNYYQWYADGKYYYFQIKPEDFQKRELANFEPIPLTEEILLKCGFEKGIEFFSYNNFYIDLNEWFVFNNMVAKAPLKHLHQLQNLYFVLTNEELNIEL